MTKEIIFPKDTENQSEINPYFKEEANAMSNAGISIGTEPHSDSDILIYRGFIIKNKNEYPQDPRYIQGWKEYEATSKLSVAYPLISDICIPTFFVDKLDENVIGQIRKIGWDKAFIKNDVKSLWDKGELASVWPYHSIDELKSEYEARYPGGKYAVRKFIDPSRFYNEERYWVIMGKVYHRTGIIPDIVRTAAKRLSVLGSHYYTIDAIDDYIVEINPGESSDRFGENSAELFASWWKEALERDLHI